MASLPVELAIEQIWCTPGQDHQLVLEPKCISVNRVTSGDSIVVRSYTTTPLEFMSRTIYLPIHGKEFFVYFIGSAYRSNFLFWMHRKEWELERWYPFSKAINESKLFVRLFTRTGLCMPLCETYFMYTNENALLLAVRYNTRIPLPAEVVIPIPVPEPTPSPGPSPSPAPEPTPEPEPVIPQLFLRFYRNAFYTSTRSLVADFQLKSRGFRKTTGISTNPAEDPINNLFAEMQALTQDKGFAMLYVNGRRLINPSPQDIQDGDIVEYIYDPSIKRVELIRVSSLRTYNSELDNESKFLVRSLENDNSTIDYYDDMEFDVVNTVRTGTYRGLHYPVVTEKSVRMVTHRDYGIPVAEYNAIRNAVIADNPGIAVNSFFIEIKTRHSGYQRPLVPTRHYIEEMYRLSSTRVTEILTSVPPIFPPFHAVALEKGFYTRTMEAKRKEDITEEDILTFLGYHGLQSLLYTNLVPVPAGPNPKVSVPRGFRSRYMAQEYSRSLGPLYYENVTNNTIGFHEVDRWNDTGTVLPANVARYVEFLKQRGSYESNAFLGNSPINYRPQYSFRVYACAKVLGTPTYNWTDITDTNQYSANPNTGKISFTTPGDPRYLMVRDDSTFLFTSATTSGHRGTLVFDILESIDRGFGAGPEEIPVQVAAGNLIVILNGKTLVRDIDYILDGKTVYVWNYAHRKFTGLPTQAIGLHDTTQTISYRVTGLGDGSGLFDEPAARGFIEHGFVGVGYPYLPKNGRSVRVTINGEVRLPGEVEFSQDYPTVVRPNHPLNGLPYQIDLYNNPVEAIPGVDLAQLKAQAAVEDQALIDFMEAELGSADRGPDVSTVLVEVVCPFFSRLTVFLYEREYERQEINSARTDEEVEELLEPFEALWDNSPFNSANGIDSARFKIRPTHFPFVVPLRQTEYDFLVRVLDLYGGDLFVPEDYYNTSKPPLPPLMMGEGGGSLLGENLMLIVGQS